MEEKMMEQEVQEVEVKEKKELCPFDFVTIPVKQYRKMIRKIAELEAAVEIEKAKSERNSYRDRAWAAESERDNLRKMLNEAKNDLADAVGLDEANKAMLSKGENANAE